jgi:hypothetical protein
MKLNLLFLSILIVSACSKSEHGGFTGGGSAKKSPVSRIDSEQNPNSTFDPENSADSISGDGKDVQDSNMFAIKGKSLDVYFVIDASGSLQKNDPGCLRFAAFQLFQEELKKLLGPTGDVRASVILFANSARLLSTQNDYLKLTTEEITSLYKSSICSNSSGTNATAALNLTASTAQQLQALGKKEVSSALFFTDGRPSGGLTSELTKASDSIKATFPSHVYGLLLNKTTDNDATPLDFIISVAGSKDRVRSTLDPNGLSASILSFIKN